MQSFDSYHGYLADRLTMLRAACVTEATIGAPEGVPSCFFMVNSGSTTSGIIPSSSFGVAAPLRMVDLEASVECTNAELIIMGHLPSALVHPINRQIDQAIVSALDDCRDVLTVDIAGAALDAVMKSDVKLGDKEVPIEDEDSMFALITPAMRAMLVTQTEFGSGDYVHVKHGNRQHKAWRWAGKNWLVLPHLKHSYVFHRHALGHALDLAALAVPGAVTGGIDPKTGTGWMKAKTKHLAAVLQPQGIVRLVEGGATQ
jgi:hypothetical protein